MRPPPPMQIRLVVAEDIAAVALDVVGLALTAGLLAAVVAAAFQWYAREQLPDGVAVLVGLGVVALYLNATAALAQVISLDPTGTAVLTVGAAARNVLALGAGAVVGVAGARVGDRVVDRVATHSVRGIDGQMGALVRAVGRVTAVELPPADAIEDIDNHDPVSPETKATLGGRTLRFPRGLTVEELRERLVERLRADFDVGVVDVDLAADGTVSYLAVGSRLAGIGPTLSPGSAAVAVRADPAFAASPGDIVQVWRGGTRAERITTAEVRATVGDVVTLAIDDADAAALGPAEQYRLVTLPAESRADREFAGLLRAADETMAVVSVEAEAALDGATIGDLDVPVIALRPEGGSIEAIPSRSRTLAAGDTVYVVARPDAIRSLTSMSPPEPS